MHIWVRRIHVNGPELVRLPCTVLQHVATRFEPLERLCCNLRGYAAGTSTARQLLTSPCIIRSDFQLYCASCPSTIVSLILSDIHKALGSVWSSLPSTQTKIPARTAFGIHRLRHCRAPTRGRADSCPGLSTYIVVPAEAHEADCLAPKVLRAQLIRLPLAWAQTRICAPPA